ncbi:MAG TPA: ParB N-terminal domain-containing protein [Verrucomicrobiae bacterium]|nr:ParB N-terminal domain-containing protein [Verrucomicrobiae bacterium]
MGVLAELGNQLTVARVAITALREQDVNARTMNAATFERLVANIRRRGELESLPYCARVNGKVEIVSGHHRVRAARAAGLTEITVLIDESGLSRSAVTAKQLAHNALAGEDDQEVLRRLLADITDADDLLETGLPIPTPDDASLIPPLLQPHVDLSWRTVTLLFLPDQYEDFTALLKTIDGRPDLVGAVPGDQFDAFLQAAAAFARHRNVRNLGTTIALLTACAQTALAAETA